MDKMRIIIGLIIIAVIVFVAFILFGSVKNIPFLSPSKTVTINNHSFSVTIANTTAEKEKGLSDRSSLPQDQGMYFPFPTAGYYAFWMKGMEFPLDIIFINNGTIVTVFENLPTSQETFPPAYKPNQPANAVLEVNAGLSHKYDFKPGDKVTTNF